MDVKAVGREYAETEKGKLRVADVTDKAEAKRKKQEKKRKKCQRRTARLLPSGLRKLNWTTSSSQTTRILTKRCLRMKRTARAAVLLSPKQSRPSGAGFAVESVIVTVCGSAAAGAGAATGLAVFTVVLILKLSSPPCGQRAPGLFRPAIVWPPS